LTKAGGEVILGIFLLYYYNIALIDSNENNNKQSSNHHPSTALLDKVAFLAMLVMHLVERMTCNSYEGMSLWRGYGQKTLQVADAS
jgi:hypothetical protein